MSFSVFMALKMIYKVNILLNLTHKMKERTLNENINIFLCLDGF